MDACSNTFCMSMQFAQRDKHVLVVCTETLQPREPWSVFAGEGLCWPVAPVEREDW